MVDSRSIRLYLSLERSNINDLDDATKKSSGCISVVGITVKRRMVRLII